MLYWKNYWDGDGSLQLFRFAKTKMLESLWDEYMARHTGDLFLFEMFKIGCWSIWLSFWMICMLHRLVRLVVISWFGSLPPKKGFKSQELLHSDQY